MKELDLFLEVLEELTGNMYIHKLTVIPQKPIPAYKEYTLEVWKINKKEKEIISDIKVIRKSISSSEQEAVKKEITKEIIKSILKTYGIQ